MKHDAFINKYYSFIVSSIKIEPQHGQKIISLTMIGVKDRVRLGQKTDFDEKCMFGNAY